MNTGEQLRDMQKAFAEPLMKRIAELEALLADKALVLEKYAEQKDRLAELEEALHHFSPAGLGRRGQLTANSTSSKRV